MRYFAVPLAIYIIPDVGCNGRGWDQGYRSQRCRLKGHKGIGTRVLGPGLGRRAPEGFAIIILAEMDEIIYVEIPALK